MARNKNSSNGRLEEALAALAQSQTQNQAALVQAHASLAQAQATLVSNQAAFLARASEIDARMAETDRINSERFARIEALLLEHNRILRALPEAIREKIGFKASAPPTE